MDFAFPGDQRAKTKEHKKRHKCIDLTRELRTLRNMPVTVMQLVTEALETVLKGLERRLKKMEIGGRAETNKTTPLIRSAQILRRVLDLTRLAVSQTNTQWLVIIIMLWEPYPSYHNGLFSSLLVLRDFAAREADQYRCYPNSTRLLTFSMKLYLSCVI